MYRVWKMSSYAVCTSCNLAKSQWHCYIIIKNESVNSTSSFGICWTLAPNRTLGPNGIHMTIRTLGPNWTLVPNRTLSDQTIACWTLGPNSYVQTARLVLGRQALHRTISAKPQNKAHAVMKMSSIYVQYMDNMFCQWISNVWLHGNVTVQLDIYKHGKNTKIWRGRSCLNSKQQDLNKNIHNSPITRNWLVSSYTENSQMFYHHW